MRNLPQALHRCLLVLCLLSTPVLATTLDDLVEKDQLQVRSWLEPATDIVPGQQLKLVLEFATDRWFAGGTRIKIPEVPGLVILQSESFASNSSETRNGQSWVVQRWSLEVYPQREGTFTLPRISARLSVNVEGTTAIEGELLGPSLQFSASTPEPLSRAEHWVAAPQYSVAQSFDRDLEDLRVGDAVEREVVFEANDVMAMMLPTFEEQTIPGLTAYPDPPQLKDSSNRGIMVATRRQRIVYIVETEGEYQLPAKDFFWWDTTTGEAQLLSLPATQLRAAGAAGEASGEEEKDKPDLAGILPWVGAALGLGVLMLLAIKLWQSTLPARVAQAFQDLRRRWQKLRAPALPDKLNPGNTAGG